MGEPVTVFASFEGVTGRTEELESLLRLMVGHTRAEPGCERYDLYRGRGSAGVFHLIERYRDEKALEEHRAAPYYLEYRRRVVDLIEGGVGVVVLEPIDVAD